MNRNKLLGENFAYVAKKFDKVEAMVKAYERLSEEEKKAFLCELYGLIA